MDYDQPESEERVDTEQSNSGIKNARAFLALLPAFATKMRSLACTLILAGLGLVAFFVAIALGLPRTQLSALIAASLFVSAFVAFIQFRFIERRCPLGLQAVAASALVIISFVLCWQVLWAASEEFVIWKTISNAQAGDDGARWLYQGMSGMGNADGFTRPSKMLERLLLFGGGGAVLLGFPFAWLLTAFKKRTSEPQK